MGEGSSGRWHGGTDAQICDVDHILSDTDAASEASTIAWLSMAHSLAVRGLTPGRAAPDREDVRRDVRVRQQSF